MKNKYNFSQVAAIYCAELEIDALEEMEQYLKGIFSDLLTDKEEDIIKMKTRNKENRSEYFPDFYN